jgi:hypothetical protein
MAAITQHLIREITVSLLGQGNKHAVQWRLSYGHRFPHGESSPSTDLV